VSEYNISINISIANACLMTLLHPFYSQVRASQVGEMKFMIKCSHSWQKNESLKDAGNSRQGTSIYQHYVIWLLSRSSEALRLPACAVVECVYVCVGC